MPVCSGRREIVDAFGANRPFRRFYDPAIDLVFLHGFAASNFTWRNIIPAFASRHRVVALERTWVAVEDSVRATADAVRAAGLDRPVLIGHSAGAEIAAVLAASGEVALRGLVLESPVIGRGAPPLARRFARLPGLDRVAPSVLRSLVRVGFDRVLAGMWSDRSTLTGDVIRGYREPLLAPGALEAMWALAADQAVSGVDWRAIGDLPCLVIRGDRDRWATPVDHHGATTVVYPDCGHLPHEEQPARFIADLETFLVDVSARSA